MRKSVFIRSAGSSWINDPVDNVIVTVGGSEAIDIAMRAIVNPGDEVILMEPSYVAYTPSVELTGA